MRSLTLSVLLLFFLFNSLAYSSERELGQIAFEERDYSAALKMLTPFAQDGDPDAQFMVGFIYHRIEDFQDHFKAVKWYKLAVNNLQPVAAHNLAIIYEGSMYDKNIIKQDYKEAMRLYLLSAKLGYLPSVTNIARMYSHGKGVSINHEESIRWYLLAAENGFSDANFNIGIKYINGTGVEKNYVKALMWFILGVELNNYSSERVYKRFSKLKEDHLKYLSEEEIAYAENLALECISRNYRNCFDN